MRKLVLAAVFLAAVAAGVLLATRSEPAPLTAADLIPPAELLPELQWIVEDDTPGWLRCDESTLPAEIGPGRTWYHSPAYWDGDERLLEPSDVESLLDYVQLSIVVLEPRDAQRLVFDDIVAAIAACEPSTSSDGIADRDLSTRGSAPVEAGDNAVQLEAMFDNTLLVGHGHVTIVEFGDQVIVAFNERSTAEWATEQRYGFDTWSAAADAELMPNILRRHLDDLR